MWQDPAQRLGVQAEKWSSMQPVAGTRGRRSTPAGRYVKAAAAPSLVSEEQWRQLRVRRLAWLVPGRRRQREVDAEKS